MILHIDTTNKDFIKLCLEKEGRVFKSKKIKAYRHQAEKLLPAIEKLFLDNKVLLKTLTKIKVAHCGDSFTSLRIGVLTANALAYALGIKVETIDYEGQKIKKLKNFNIVVPRYNRDPDIKIKKI